MLAASVSYPQNTHSKSRLARNFANHFKLSYLLHSCCLLIYEIRVVGGPGFPRPNSGSGPHRFPIHRRIMTNSVDAARGKENTMSHAICSLLLKGKQKNQCALGQSISELSEPEMVNEGKRRVNDPYFAKTYVQRECVTAFLTL